jgi:hypothetical protein
MKIITYSMYKTVEFMGNRLEIPPWIKYLALAPRTREGKADVIAFSHKPRIKSGLWHSNVAGSRKEAIGFASDCPIKYGDDIAIYKTLFKVPA